MTEVAGLAAAALYEADHPNSHKSTLPTHGGRGGGKRGVQPFESRSGSPYEVKTYTQAQDSQVLVMVAWPAHLRP